jgi:hypothetical protein
MVKKHQYTGYISFGYTVFSDEPLQEFEIIDAIEQQINAEGIPECDLGEITHYLEGED